MRIRSTKPEFWLSERIGGDKPKDWARFGFAPVLGGLYLYRFFDGWGRLLYVGITGCPRYRWTEHARKRPWWRDVEYVILHSCADEWSARDAEREAIRTESPAHNKHQNPRWHSATH